MVVVRDQPADDFGKETGGEVVKTRVHKVFAKAPPAQRQAAAV